MKFSLHLFAAFSLLGQDLFEKAPPEVDEALRQRVKEFYQCHVDGTFRKAEKYVAEESQEFFYQVQKQRYDSCELLKIAYANDFNKATVTQICKGKWNIGGNDMAVSMPLSSQWVRNKDNGTWFWVHLQSQEVDSPWGRMKYDAAKDSPKGTPGTGAQIGGPVLGMGGAMPTDLKTANELLAKQVTVDKQKIELSSFQKSSDAITVVNNSGGKVQVKFEYEAVVPGFTAKFDKEELAPGEKAVLSLNMAPKDRVAKPTIQGRILIESLLQQFPVTVTFAVPPEVEKMLPKKK